MSISSLVLESWQFSFIRDWPQIRKSEIRTSDFCPISGDWDELWKPNLAQMSLIKWYWMLQNSKFQGYSFYRFWVIKRKPTVGGGGDRGRGGKITLSQPRFWNHLVEKCLVKQFNSENKVKQLVVVKNVGWTGYTEPNIYLRKVLNI